MYRQPWWITLMFVVGFVNIGLAAVLGGLIGLVLLLTGLNCAIAAGRRVSQDRNGR